MDSTLRDAVTESNQHPVAALLDNSAMHRYTEYPRGGHLGARLKWWREKGRQLTRGQLATLSGVPYSTIAEIENQSQHSSTKITQLAAALRINAHYLGSGEGDPEQTNSTAAPSTAGMGLPGFDPDLIADFDDNELELLAMKINRIAEEIRSRRSGKKTASR